MSAEPKRPGAVDCLKRGLSSLHANWELVPMVAAQSILTLGLTAAGFLVLFSALGISVVAWVRELGPGWMEQLGEEIVTGLETAPPLLPLLLPLLAATLIWTLAFGLYCYLQGGVMGILVEAEVAAGAGLPGWRSFRCFSLSEFDAQGRQLFWRYFWFNHLLAAVGLALMTLMLGLVVLAVVMASGPEPALGVAVGCVGLVPLALLLFAAALWSMLATVEVARPGAGVWAASRRAVGALRRRLGPVLLIWLIATAAWMAVSGVLTPIKWSLAIASGDHFSLWLAGRGALMLAETLISSTVVVALIAALAALLGGRLRPEAEPAP